MPDSISKKEKRILYAVFAGLLACAFLACGILYLVYLKPSAFDASALTPVAADGEIVFAIDEDILKDGGYTLGHARMGRSRYMFIKEAGHGEGYLTLAGWAFIPEHSIMIPSSHFVLRGSNGTCWQLPTTTTGQDEVTEQYGEGVYNYTLCGLYAAINTRFMAAGEYELLIAYTNDGASLLLETGYTVQI